MKDTVFSDVHEMHCEAIFLKTRADSLVRYEQSQSPMKLGMMLREADTIRQQAHLIMVRCDALKTSLVKKVDQSIHQKHA